MPSSQPHLARHAQAGVRMVIDEFTLTYLGIKNVHHEFFYAVHGADEPTRRGYLARTHTLGREFWRGAIWRGRVTAEGCS